MTVSEPERPAMSDYERKRWAELQAHWEKVDRPRRQLLPMPARRAMGGTVDKTRRDASRAGKAVAEWVPDKIRTVGEKVVDAALIPTLSTSSSCWSCSTT